MSRSTATTPRPTTRRVEPSSVAGDAAGVAGVVVAGAVVAEFVVTVPGVPKAAVVLAVVAPGVGLTAGLVAGSRGVGATTAGTTVGVVVVTLPEGAPMTVVVVETGGLLTSPPTSAGGFGMTLGAGVTTPAFAGAVVAMTRLAFALRVPGVPRAAGSALGAVAVGETPVVVPVLLAGVVPAEFATVADVAAGTAVTAVVVRLAGTAPTDPEEAPIAAGSADAAGRATAILLTMRRSGPPGHEYEDEHDQDCSQAHEKPRVGRDLGLYRVADRAPGRGRRGGGVRRSHGCGDGCG